MPTLWPNFAGVAAPRSMAEMLYDAAGDIGTQTSGKLDFYVDIVGIGAAGAVQHIRHNCYLRVPKNHYSFLLFQVTTPVGSPFPATAATPEGEEYANLVDEGAFRDAVLQILQRDRTKEVVLYLLSTAP